MGQSGTDIQIVDLLTIINTIGFPLLLIYAHFRGWVVTPRELKAALRYADDMQERYRVLETEVRADRVETRKELAETRKELAETRSMLIQTLIAQKRESGLVEGMMK